MLIFRLILQKLSMQVHYNIDELPYIEHSVVTIGSFDGVHKGHIAILNQLKFEAEKISGATVVITFHPHPRKILHALDAPSLLTSLDERIALFHQNGIDHLVIVPFDLRFSELEAADYIEQFLVHHFHPKIIVIGFDHRFGKERKGDYTLLRSLGVQFGYEVVEIPEKVLKDSKISSTNIRNTLLEGKISETTMLLGYYYQLEGLVIKGDQLGRKLGFPTANLAITETEKLIPLTGVYAVNVVVKKTEFPVEKKGMMNIGYRPTVNGKERRIEVNIFEFDEDIYGQIICVELIQFIRNEMKFSGLEALKEQLHTDKQQIKLIHENLMTK
jgi:riboflavin kinase/FMN adenylyltransferase